VLREFNRLQAIRTGAIDMASRQNTHLTNQMGHDRVKAELSRRGFIVTNSTGKRPAYISVAVDDEGRYAQVQVKAMTADKWQLNIGRYADVAFEGRKQIIRGQLDDPYPDLVCVMVQIAPRDSGRADCFFVLPWHELGQIVIEGHRRWLAKHGGVRPRNPYSLHTTVHPEALADSKDRWQILTERVRSTPANKAL